MRGRAAFQHSRREDYCADRQRPAVLHCSVACRSLDILVDSGYKSVCRCIQSLQCRELYQTAGHLTMC